MNSAPSRQVLSALFLLIFVTLVDALASDIPSVPSSSQPFHVLKPDQLVFYNADHSPFGAHSSFVYGLDENRGQENTHPVDLLIGSIPDGHGTTGREGRFMPFVDKVLRKQIGLVKKSNITRQMSACTDTWKAGTLSWIHYTPAWSMPEWSTANLAERKRLVLPATWMEIEFDNTASRVAQTLLVGIPVSASKRSFFGGQAGFTFGDQALSVAAGDCRLLGPAALSAALHVHLDHAFAFALRVPAGQKRTLLVTQTTYHAGPVFGGSTVYSYTKLFGSMDEVVAEAARQFAAAKTRSLYLNDKLSASGQNIYRQFLAGDALHSYLYNTALLAKPDGSPVMLELEGEYEFLNTLDLTVDHVFYQSAMYPWITRNILDEFSSHYSYRSKVVDPAMQHTAERVLSFCHDMGQHVFSTPGKSAYEKDKNFMSQEELQNWILCAGIYWKKSGDTSWLKGNAALLSECLHSMLFRDSIDPTRRDGLTKVTDARGEITTYDALDASLSSPVRSTYIAVKSWAVYLALEAMLDEIGDTTGAARAHKQAVRCSQTLLAHFDLKEHYIPALLDGKNTSRIIPAVEGLIYPAEMGLSDDVSESGPFGLMIRMLRIHLDTVLRPGVCLDATSGGWKLSSTSNNTWESKVYLSQYIAENILGLSNDRTHGTVDAVHATLQVLGTPVSCWSDQLDSAGGSPLGSEHYPRGVTSSLWWLKTRR